MEPLYLDNLIVEYVKNVGDVPHVGQMEVHVRISREPIFEDRTSMRLTYRSELLEGHPGAELGGSTVSYGSVRADAYRGRMEVDVVLPHACLTSRDRPYQASRQATVRLLPDIIAEHERMMGAREAPQS